MKIEYLGHSCFRITCENGTTIVTDPYTRVGYELSAKTQADIVTVSHGHFDHNFTAAIAGKKTVVSEAGTHTLGGVTVKGFVCNHDDKGGSLRGKNVVFTFFADGLKVCHLGDLGEACSEALLEKIGCVDILLIPVGGTYTINAVQAKGYVDALRPKIAVPMHYRPSDGTLDITSAEAFLKLCDNVIYTKKNKAIDLMEYAVLGKTQVVFMERTNG